MINLKIICFFDDVDLSMDVIRICNSRNYDLIFPDFKDFLKEVNDISFGVVIIDMEEPKYHESNLVNTVYKKTYLPIIGYKDKINKKIKEEANEIGCDIIIDKETLKRNLDIIFEQIIKEITDKSKT